jgi:hypothetical protein
VLFRAILLLPDALDILLSIVYSRCALPSPLNFSCIQTQSELKASGQDKSKLLLKISTSSIKLLEQDGRSLRDTHKLSNISFVSALTTDKKVSSLSMLAACTAISEHRA